MFRWHLITHNLHALQLVTSKARLLGVEVYCPTKLEVKKRRDCNGTRTTSTPLFPGYLFVRLDPEVVHPSVIADIPGVKEFVRFGGDISTVSNALIEALKQSLILRADEKVKSLECRNVSQDVLNKLSEIAVMKSKIERQTAFFNLLQSDSQLIAMGNLPYSRITSVIEKPKVDENVW
ncbi:transcription termination/antitermination NusG family protein [Pseudomonas corrugata]|uniref:transcription termination/antitermination NusG family protein n=1 Tax=Pseudomonas corrugata TaxID=47879 RepID=UPI0009BEC3AE|nr:transcription termination/antitermination NusG family protein [Pseudomonas corrugata]